MAVMRDKFQGLLRTRRRRSSACCRSCSSRFNALDEWWVDRTTVKADGEPVAKTFPGDDCLKASGRFSIVASVFFTRVKRGPAFLEGSLDDQLQLLVGRSFVEVERISCLLEDGAVSQPVFPRAGPAKCFRVFTESSAHIVQHAEIGVGSRALFSVRFGFFSLMILIV